MSATKPFLLERHANAMAAAEISGIVTMQIIVEIETSFEPYTASCPQSEAKSTVLVADDAAMGIIITVTTPTKEEGSISLRIPNVTTGMIISLSTAQSTVQPSPFCGLKSHFERKVPRSIIASGVLTAAAIEKQLFTIDGVSKPEMRFGRK